ncbi:MAG: DUF58 domain-containing protein [Rudaea sp.]
MRSAPAARWSRFLALAERRLPALTRMKRVEPLPIVLHRRRIYVVPTRFGLAYSAMLIVMLLGALNYNNNPALLLTCLVGAATYQSIFSGFRTLNRLALRSLKARPCHAGDVLRVSLHFDSASLARRALRMRLEMSAQAAGAPAALFDLSADEGTTVDTELRAPARGWQTIGRIRVWTEFPFGLFHVWSWLHPDFRALVYPRPEANAPPLPAAGSESSAAAMRRSGDEFAMLRDYQTTDPRRLIAWKASARHDRLLVKEFERPQGQEIVLDWRATAGIDSEARLSRLTAWVLRAEATRVQYALVLPHVRVAAGIGSDHAQRCLRELALAPQAGT